MEAEKHHSAACGRDSLACYWGAAAIVAILSGG